MSVIKVKHIEAKPGEKKTGFLDIGATSVNMYRLPVAIINGKKPGKKLALLGGTHGTEFASIEAVIRTIQKLDPEKMTGTVIAIPVLNGPQFEHRSAFLSPYDQLNQNRQFPGDPDGTLSKRTAHLVFSEIVSQCDALIDCHGGDVNEDIDDMVIAGEGDDEKVNMLALKMASCFPTRYVSQLPRSVSGLTMTAQKLYNIPCVTSEAGTPFPVRERHIQFHYKGIKNNLKLLGIIKGEPILSDPVINPKGYREHAKQGGIWHSHVELGDEVEKGMSIGDMTDLFGKVYETYHAPEDSTVTFLRIYYSVNVGEVLYGLTVLK